MEFQNLSIVFLCLIFSVTCWTRAICLIDLNVKKIQQFHKWNFFLCILSFHSVITLTFLPRCLLRSSMAPSVIQKRMLLIRSGKTILRLVNVRNKSQPSSWFDERDTRDEGKESTSVDRLRQSFHLLGNFMMKSHFRGAAINCHYVMLWSQKNSNILTFYKYDSR